MTAAALALAALVGLALGVAYAAGLWWTLRALPRLKRPTLMLLASSVLRVAVVVGAALVLYSGDLPGLLAMMAGFVLARLLATRFMANQAAAGPGGAR